MLKIKKLFLKNYAGFKNENEFNFVNTDGSFKPMNVFFGPNGCGKSTALNAIAVLSRAKHYANRGEGEENLLLRKMKFHPNYDPSYLGFTKYKDDMEITGTFWDGSRDLVVQIKNDEVIKNDLAWRGVNNCVFIDADHPINMNKFQIPSARISLFMDLARTIYGYKCFVEKQVPADGTDTKNHSLNNILKIYADNIDKIKAEAAPSTMSTSEVYSAITTKYEDDSDSFYQDFVIEKGDVLVHHKSMSAGEKKIATLLRNLCDPSVIDKSDIVMVDNLEMHVYFKRHTKMLDKLIDCFPEKQFIVTTHSSIMIDHVRNKYNEDCLFDIPTIKGQLLID